MKLSETGEKQLRLCHSLFNCIYIRRVNEGACGKESARDETTTICKILNIYILTIFIIYIIVYVFYMRLNLKVK